MSTLIGTCPGCGEAVDLAKPHTCDRERKLQRALNAELNENFRLRASLAAAEAKLADANEQIRLDVLNENTLRQALADERKHADELARVIEKAIELCEEGTMPRSTLGVGVDLHAARRQEEAR